jgi:hypothetical protein
MNCDWVIVHLIGEYVSVAQVVASSFLGWLVYLRDPLLFLGTFVILRLRQ